MSETTFNSATTDSWLEPPVTYVFTKRILDAIRAWRDEM